MDMVMEAYADAGVKYGLPRALAYKLISQTMLGSAKLQMDSGSHPAVLKDEVCSPKGTTIRGVAALEEKGLRHACISSIDAIMESKSKK
jgi:pyrroline-5-carboxylate reductase